MLRLEVALALMLLTACSAAGAKRTPDASPNRLSAEGRMNVGLAQSYLQADQVKKAAGRAKLALASDPGSADVHALFAMIHTRNGQLDKAEREFDRALRIAPLDGSILNAHASWLCERGRSAQADEEFSRALQDASYRSPFQALSNAGKCAHQAAQWSKAEAYFRRALDIAPNDLRVLLLLADTELRQGSIFEAQAFIQRRDSLGSDAETLQLAARIEDAANNRLAAARYRQRLLNEFPNYVPTGEGARSP